MEHSQTRLNPPMTRGLFFKELRLELGKVLKRYMPESTLRRWLKQTGIGNREEYSQSDLTILAFYGNQLKERPKVLYAQRKLNEFLIHEYQEDQTSTNRTVQVDATAV